MPTSRIKEYADKLLESNVDEYSGFLGAYNMGVWGYSISGQPVVKQGLLASGHVLDMEPDFSSSSHAVIAQNFVKYYDTPHLWGYGDGSSNLKNALNGKAKISDPRQPWSKVGTKNRVQQEMDKVLAWRGLVERWKTVIAQSTQLVDITSLSPPIRGSEAQIGICSGIYKCLENWLSVASDKSKKPPRLMIRLLFGMTAVKIPIKGTNSWWNEFYQDLVNTLRPLSEKLVATGRDELPEVLYGSDMGSTISTFNHSKIVAGDGQYAVVGGHNMCEEVSSNRAPVIHDVTCEVTGPGALSANAFAGSLWLKAAESGRLYIHRFNWEKKKFDDLTKKSAAKWAPKNKVAYGLGKQEDVQKVLDSQLWYYSMRTLPETASIKPPQGSVAAAAVMGIGRWGNTKVFGIDCTKGLKLKTKIPPAHACQYASDTLKRIMIEDPKNTIIRMAQQDLVNAGFFGGLQKDYHTICEAIGNRLLASKTGTAIQIVVSSRFTQNCEGLAYSYGDGPREAAERISDTVVGVKQASSFTRFLPDRLADLNLKTNVPRATEYAIKSKTTPSFCTIAPFAFCEARGTDRTRGSYVWPDAKFKMEKLYTKGRFWNSDDAKELTFGPGNHSKVMYVSTGDDDATGLVMIGSDNMYPSPLSEFSFIIEGAAAIKAFREQYWDHLWKYSAPLGFTVDANGDVS